LDSLGCAINIKANCSGVFLSIIQNPVRNRSRLIDADGDCAWGNVLDYLDIHQFALRIGFSLSEGDDMRTIRATIENSTRNSNKVESVQIPYPTGLLDISNIQLATGFFINPMFISAEYFLHSPGYLILKPEINCTTFNTVILSGLTLLFPVVSSAIES
jgi:hypothetical protein